MKPVQSMILPMLLSASLWVPLGAVYTQLSQLSSVFKHSTMFEPSEFQSDAQKKEIKHEARNYITSLQDTEKKELKRRKEQMLEIMSPEERKHWP